MERHDKRLTEHFCLDEFTYSGIAVDNAIISLLLVHV